MMKPSKSLLLFPLLALGIYLGSLSFLNISLMVALFIVLLALWLYLSYKNKISRDFFILIWILGTLLVGYLSVLPQKIWQSPREGDFVGEVYQVQSLNYDQRILVRLKSSRLKVAVHLPSEVNLKSGDQLSFTGEICEPQSAANPGAFCYRQYLRRLGVFGVCYPSSYKIESVAAQGILNLLKTRLRNNLLKSVKEPDLILALVLGERDLLESQRKENWRLLGITHLLAISGMHVGLVALGLGFFVNRLPFRPLIKLLAMQLLLLVYIIVAGSGASAWRALLISLFGGYASFRGIRQDPLNLWASAGWILLLIKPVLIFDVGFILSFAASGGIILWSPTLTVRSNNRIFNYLANSLLISTVAQLSLAPFLFGYFGEISLLGPLATLIFLPCVVVLMVGGFFTALGCGFCGFSFLLNTTISVVNNLESLLLPLASQWRLGVLTLPEVLMWWCGFLYAGWQFRKPRLTKPKRTIANLITLTVILIFISCLPPVVRRPLEITAVNVGQGDCFFIKTPSGVHLLIDGGGDSPYWQQRGRNVGIQRVVPYLEYRHVKKIDYVILSHPHEDHLFGLLAVLEHFEIGMVIDNGHEHTSPTYQRYLELIDEKDIYYHTARAGEQLNLGDGISLQVLYPAELRPNLPSAYNNNSLLLKLQYGALKFLFTGDLENAVLYDLANELKEDLSAQWLKVPHHGSKGSLLEDFYQAVMPSWALIPVGHNNFGQPHSEVLDFLNQQQISWRSTIESAQTFQAWWGFWGRFKASAT